MESLETMRAVDIRTVDRKSLVDVKQLKAGKVPEEWDTVKCTARFIERVKNPYCFLVGKVVVKSVFTEGVTLDQRFKELIEAHE